MALNSIFQTEEWTVDSRSPKLNLKCSKSRRLVLLNGENNFTLILFGNGVLPFRLMVLIGENLGKIKITCQFWCFISNNSCQSLVILFMFSLKNAFCLSIFNLSQFVFHKTMKNDKRIQPNMLVINGNPHVSFAAKSTTLGLFKRPPSELVVTQTLCEDGQSLHQNWLLFCLICWFLGMRSLVKPW